jgi:nucleoside-diphosphate-sugar epimerase
LKVLFIGGTGNISSAVSRLAIKQKIDLYLLSRGSSKTKISGAKTIICDISNYTEAEKLLKEHNWDVVVNWIAFNEKDIERDIKLFTNKTKQYIFISTASAYQKPLSHPIITESTPLINPFWEYSQHKILCEERLNKEYRENTFPITIVRPSFTYDTVIPTAIGGWDEYTIIDRMKKGKKIIVHGDGASLWTITHSADFAKGFIGLLSHAQAIGHAFHITSDEVLTWNQIYETIADAINVKPNIVHIASDFIKQFKEFDIGTLIGDKAVSAIFDNSKIKSFVPDFKAAIPFKKGIIQTLKWYEDNPEKKIIKQETNNLIDKIISTYEK